AQPPQDQRQEEQGRPGRRREEPRQQHQVFFHWCRL
ncbi:hypothetical protein BN1723_019690, partial [Verticillium longisporum]